MLSYGKIVQVSGPVVDCEFQEGQLPKIREALRVQVEDEVRTMEVAQHMDEHTVRCIMLAPSEGLSRGMTVEATGQEKARKRLSTNYVMNTECLYGMTSPYQLNFITWTLWMRLSFLLTQLIL